MANYITVKGKREKADIDPQEGNPVIFSEKDPSHPNGEIFIADDGNTYKVGETAAIKRLIHEGQLVKVSGSSEAPKAPAVPKKE